MAVMIVYIATVLVSEFIAIEIGLYLDVLSPSYSLPLALSLFFAALFLAWPVAVMITERWIIRGEAT